MTRFNFKETCLLAASGELGPAARQHFLAHLRQNPAARLEYEEIRKEFELLELLPVAGISHQQHNAIPAQLKIMLHQAVEKQQREKQAAARRLRIRHAFAGITSAAAVIAIVAFLGIPHRAATALRERDQIARLQATVDHLVVYSDQPVSSYDQAMTDVEASIRQLQTESPTLAQVHDRGMGNLLDVLATVSLDSDDFATAELPPPGSL